MKDNRRKNNFDLMRLLAAFLVLAGHMGHILGVSAPVLLGQEVQSLGAKILFLLGGYFIAKSWHSDRNLIHYWVKRMTRIWPPMIAAILFAAFVIGPAFTTLSAKEYFAHPGTWFYIYKNILFYPVYALPGVFENAVYPFAVNGSLWTMPVELLMYAAVPIVSLLLFRNAKPAFAGMCLFTASVCLFQILHLQLFPGKQMVVYGTDLMQAMDLVPFYLIGMLMSYPVFRKIADIRAASFMLIIGCCLNFGLTANYLMVYLLLPYFVFSFGWDETICAGRWMSEKTEISYGLYLYGFPVQQAVVIWCGQHQIALSFASVLMVSTFLTAIPAFLSHILIEMPIGNCIRRLLREEKEKNEARSQHRSNCI